MTLLEMRSANQVVLPKIESLDPSSARKVIYLRVFDYSNKWNKRGFIWEKSSSVCSLLPLETFYKKYQKWYTIDALGVIFAICSNFEQFYTSEKITYYLYKSRNISKIT